jgi:hypothetical protein
MTKELRSERLKTVVGITIHRNPVTQELYQSVRVGEDIVKRIKTSRQKGYVLRKGESVEEVSSIWQNLPHPMKKVDAFKFASRDPRSDFINNSSYVEAFEDKIAHIEGRLMREAKRVSRPKVNSAEELLKLIKSTPENTVEESEHVNMG